MDMTIERVPWADPDAEGLRAAQRFELDARYGSDDHEPGVVPSADDVPVFLIARDRDGRALVCGGLRPLAADVLGADVAEIKRMYAAPSARGTGAAAALLRALEGEARVLGIRRLVLETGTAQPDAVRFYQREGYVSIPLFGHYVDSELSLCFAKRLDAA
ncbi:GNAT family N-acetyltransferase [Microbacterium hydrocarbonoxydans]|uniref:Acetyltransferase (GNAT) family protein n=1 Tax=Microbacterium hydrocarbonoxydans TaxID=273678 RepID=A0A1H4Q7M2_9MICO|nr:GNAT family N-acetyltransferase [Microbacterium hydrocarbonoxydans]SEC15623.1 Acetyltransferase (GNAT) family protein [Microbacterium hydrocarbonoxydans]